MDEWMGQEQVGSAFVCVSFGVSVSVYMHVCMFEHVSQPRAGTEASQPRSCHAISEGHHIHMQPSSTTHEPLFGGEERVVLIILATFPFPFFLHLCGVCVGLLVACWDMQSK